MARRRGGDSRGIVIRFQFGATRGPTIPIARPPPEGEDVGSFVARIARHGGVTWDFAVVIFPDGSRKQVRRDS